jgi:endoglucanase
MGAPIAVPGDDREATPEEIWEQTGTSTGGAGGSRPSDEPPATPTAPSPAPTTPAPEPTTPPAAPAPVAMPYRGVNLAGAEFGSAIPGVDGKDYGFPTTAEVDYFLSRGLNTFRIGFKWERIQPAASGELQAVYAGKLDAIVTYVTNAGGTAIVQPHNFARYYGTTVGSSAVPNAAFADLWKRLALRYKANAKVIFNLVNEPHTMPTEQWVSAANAAIGAIRQAGATNVIHVPGNAWTGAHSWNGTWYGTANAVAMKNIVDPLDNSVIEVHQYLDQTSGGVSSSCVSETIGSERLAGWVKWLRDNGKKGFVGEIGAPSNATCDAAMKDMLDYMMKQTDVLVGWTYWAAGPRWASDYMFSIEPLSGNQDRPRMKSLLPYLF